MDNRGALLLVGSIPFETSEQVFRWVSGNGLFDLLASVPDGEVGERIYWIPMLSYRVYHGHPDIETVKRPQPTDGVESWRPRDGKDAWTFRVKRGVTEIHFGDLGWRLGYARDAINSYYVFKTLRERGVIPPGIRFQVCLPFTYSGFSSMFPLDDWTIMRPAYEEAMIAELNTITRHIPPEDLAIQWDCCMELAMVEQTGLREQGRTPDWTVAGKSPLELVSDAISCLSSGVPAGAMLGYHLCYGTLGGWPMRHGDDLEMAVQMAKSILKDSGRLVDYIHMPILDNAPASYFSPLEKLPQGSTRYYFGVIHNMKNQDDYKHKLREIGRYVNDFGIAAPCGFGRQGNLPDILKDHKQAQELYIETRAE